MISRVTHASFTEIIGDLEYEVLHPVLKYPGMIELIDIENVEDVKLKEELVECFSK